MAATQRTVFGKYRLIAELGHGGMADVFLAVQEGPKGLGFSKLVVIKRLRPNLAEDLDFVEMLVDEARIAARLNHPNAVQTYEIGEVDGQYFIAMEYLDGQPLSRIATRSKRDNKPLPRAFAISILADVLAGLHHAHELKDFKGDPLNIVHRDVTPHNVFVTYDGQVKIVDFGIAKAAGRAAQTKEGVVKGKVVYMAPEQACARTVDRRADIFATGLMLYEFVTGQRAWKGLDELGVMGKLIMGELPPMPLALDENADPTLDEICKRSLAYKPVDRYSTAEEMSKDLVAFLDARNERPLPRDLGGWLADLFSDRRRETREAIEAQLAELERKPSGLHIRVLPGTDSGPTPPSGQLTIPPQTQPVDSQAPTGELVIEGDPVSPTRHAPSKRPASATTMPSAKRPSLPSEDEDGHSTVPAPPRSRSGPWRGVVVLLGVAVLASGGALYARRALQRPIGPISSSEATVSSAAASAPPTSSTSVTVALSSDVSGTIFQIDKGQRVVAPFTGNFPLDRAQHVITATAPGYEDTTFSARFDGDVTWHAQMKRRPGVGGGQVSLPTPPNTAKTHPTAPHVDHTATAPPTTPPTATTSAKHRDIDEDNPYHKQQPPKP